MIVSPNIYNLRPRVPTASWSSAFKVPKASQITPEFWDFLSVLDDNDKFQAKISLDTIWFHVNKIDWF